MQSTRAQQGPPGRLCPGGSNMAIAITFRHMDSTEALKNYVHEKLERIQRYVRAPLDAHVTLFQERHQFIAEMHVTASGKVYQAQHDSDDMYKSIDYVIDKIEHQIAKAHDTAARNKKGAQSAADVGARATYPNPEPEEG
jgi:putative sigma-54 modulation protein